MECSRNLCLLAVLFAAWLLNDTAVAQAPEQTKAEQTEAERMEVEHEALRGLRDIAEEAINNNELDLFKPVLADDFSVVTYTDSEFSDFDKFKKRWNETREELLAGGTYTTKLNPERSQIIGDLAITRGNSENVLVTGSGVEFRFNSHWTAVCRKDDGKWKVVRAHSSLSPFDNPMLRSRVQGIVVKTGICAVMVGLVLGWFCRAAIGRFRNKS